MLLERFDSCHCFLYRKVQPFEVVCDKFSALMSLTDWRSVMSFLGSSLDHKGRFVISRQLIIDSLTKLEYSNDQPKYSERNSWQNFWNAIISAYRRLRCLYRDKCTLRSR